MSLSGDERVVWYGKRCWESLLGKIVIGIVLMVLWVVFSAIAGFNSVAVLMLFLFFFLPGLWSIINAILLHIGSEYVVTNHRVYMKYGVVRRLVSEAKFDKVTDTAFAQNVWGRLLGYGAVALNTAGTAWREIVYAGVKNPEYLNNLVRDHMKVREKHDKKQMRIERMRDKFYTGEITESQFKEAEKKILSESDL
jgi:uncharacterized membrane protein YdbT with pleckstrin-like domain